MCRRSETTTANNEKPEREKNHLPTTWRPHSNSLWRHPRPSPHANDTSGVVSSTIPRLTAGCLPLRSGLVADDGPPPVYEGRDGPGGASTERSMSVECRCGNVRCTRRTGEWCATVSGRARDGTDESVGDGSVCRPRATAAGTEKIANGAPNNDRTDTATAAMCFPNHGSSRARSAAKRGRAKCPPLAPSLKHCSGRAGEGTSV